MTAYLFNRKAPLIGPTAADVDTRLIEATPNLRRAGLHNAALFGGPLMRQLLESAPLVGDHKHVIVDTKVSLLMPGWMPAIPGWHTDGVPRQPAADNGLTPDPTYSGNPSLAEQQQRDDAGYRPRYHTIHVGNDCPTLFLVAPLTLDLDHAEDSDLYQEMTKLVGDAQHLMHVSPNPGQWATWDWWNIHCATEATARGWRLLIRVTESDIPPVTHGFIRAQNQVYVPREFGW